MSNSDSGSLEKKRLKICFFALNAYAYFTSENLEFAGGAEHQQVLLAQELARKGHIISFVVGDYGQSEVITVNGITLYKYSPPKNKFWFIPAKLKKFFYLMKVLRRTDADIYYQRAAGSVTGSIGLFSKVTRKKFVYAIAHRFDVDGTCIHNSYLSQNLRIIQWFCKFLFNLGLSLADCIIAQNNEQLLFLQKNYGKKGIIIRSIYKIPEKPIKKSKSQEIIWIASIQAWKGPEIFLELAKKIPDGQFRMIGGPSVDKDYYNFIRNLAVGIPNMKFSGFVPPSQIKEFYSDAKIFVNTSESEGFPNTFLEAWSYSIPVVTLYCDPDEIICENQLGFHSKNFSQLFDDIEKLLQDDELRLRLGQNGREYIKAEHSLESITTQYEKVFTKLMD